jgi:nucleotide-binding universal stress UspA family protein
MTDSVLVLLLDPAGAESCLRAAADAAAALPNPEVTVLHVQARPADSIMASEEVLTDRHRAAADQQGSADTAALNAAYLAWRTPSLPSRWEQVAGDPAEIIAERGAVALLAMTLPPADAPLTQRAALDAALFVEGRPLLAVPAGWTGAFGQHLAIGWRDTQATRRALRAMRPWLAHADHVSVVSVAATKPAWPDADLLGVAADRISFQAIAPKRGSEAEILLGAVADALADGLLIGAYRRGKVMEWMLGGVTREVLHSAIVPLLMVH